MAYYPRLGLQHGGDCIEFEKSELVWKLGKKIQRVPWSKIRSVRKSDEGVTLDLATGAVFIPNDYVWFDFIVEDIIERAQRENPRYEGPSTSLKPRSLAIPQDGEGQMFYARRAQRFYKDRFPTIAEFEEFLRANLGWIFDESTYYASAMSMCTGCPVDEGYSSDLHIPSTAQWFRQFQQRAGQGRYSGKALLVVLAEITA
ncbi:MAG: hypothetical protein RDV48_27065 [Candidatus Eremiobacteraeota bacterium]|nr:hypothetical protein [Candidatus Eremiobacteraeota bacterium]